jgi:hypothetical protein
MFFTNKPAADLTECDRISGRFNSMETLEERYFSRQRLGAQKMLQRTAESPPDIRVDRDRGYLFIGLRPVLSQRLVLPSPDQQTSTELEPAKIDRMMPVCENSR